MYESNKEVKRIENLLFSQDFNGAVEEGKHLLSSLSENASGTVNFLVAVAYTHLDENNHRIPFQQAVESSFGAESSYIVFLNRLPELMNGRPQSFSLNDIDLEECPIFPFYQAETLFWQGKFSEAQEAFAQVDGVEINAMGFLAQIRIADCLIAENKWEDAEKVIQEVVSKLQGAFFDGKNCLMTVAQGKQMRIQAGLGKVHEARCTARRISPDFPWGFLSRGLMRAQIHSYEGAAADLARFLSHKLASVYYADANLTLGGIALQQEDTEKVFEIQAFFDGFNSFHTASLPILSEDALLAIPKTPEKEELSVPPQKVSVQKIRQAVAKKAPAVKARTPEPVSTPAAPEIAASQEEDSWYPFPISAILLGIELEERQKNKPE